MTRVRFWVQKAARTAQLLTDVLRFGSILESRPIAGGPRANPLPPPPYISHLQTLSRPRPLPKTRGRSFENRLRAQSDPPKHVGGLSKIASWLQGVPKWIQDGSKIAPRWLHIAPRWLKMAPRWPLDGPKSHQDGSR